MVLSGQIRKSAPARQLVRRREHQIADTLPVAASTGHVVGERERVHRTSDARAARSCAPSAQIVR